ncbi:UbiD family decarboxylase [Chloroflexota bacterium]
MGKSNWKDMREFLSFLEENGELRHITEEVDPDWEVNGITRVALQEKGPAIVFDKIKGAAFPLVTGMLASEKRYLWALGIDSWSEFNEEWIKRTKQLIPPKIEKTGVCQEETITGANIDLNRICNVKWHQHDGGSFAGTLSISVTKDPDTGVLNAGIYRMATLGKNRLGWGAPEYTHGRQHYMKYERQGEPMPMAVVTGCDPIVEIAGATRMPPGVDEFHLAGALRGESLEMVKCKTINIEVPASAEWVFEGVIQPEVRDKEREGGFGEYTSYYGEVRRTPVFEIKLITHRRGPIYQGTREQWYPSESFFVTGKSFQVDAYQILKGIVPGLLDLRCDISYEAIAKIDKLYKGHPQQVMDAIWGTTHDHYKHVIVVDKDIDIWDYDSVHWALSTRVKADRDVFILPRRSGYWLDPAVPLKEREWQTCLGIDATLPTEEYEFYGERSPRTVDDPEIVARVKDKWGNTFKIE